MHRLTGNTDPGTDSSFKCLEKSVGMEGEVFGFIPLDFQSRNVF